MSHYQRAGLVFQQNLVFLEMCKGLIDSIRSVFDFCLVIWFLFKWANQSHLVTVIAFNTSYFISSWNRYHRLLQFPRQTHPKWSTQFIGRKFFIYSLDFSHQITLCPQRNSSMKKNIWTVNYMSLLFLLIWKHGSWKTLIF